ncbi:recombinase family protein [bacterium]|nr:recombinase family protein [bacterium]
MFTLIHYLHENEGLGYRRISQKLNSWGIPTIRGNKWFNTSVHSVLKRKRQRDERINNQRLEEFDTHISKFHLKYITFD